MSLFTTNLLRLLRSIFTGATYRGKRLPTASQNKSPQPQRSYKTAD